MLRNLIAKARNGFIIWAARRAPERVRIHSKGGDFVLSRYAFFFPNVRRSTGSNLPWWLPLNMMLHCWAPGEYGEEFHNHRCWTITIMLRGKIIERSPNSPPKVLTPGSVVFRDTKVYHSFRVPKGYSGKTWTLFIRGRRQPDLKQTYFKQVRKQ